MTEQRMRNGFDARQTHVNTQDSEREEWTMVSALISEPTDWYFRIEDIDSDLAGLQKVVDGDVEIVMDSRGKWHLYVDEEGKLKGKPVNRFSTQMIDELSLAAGRNRFSDHDALVGTVIWLGPLIALGDDEIDEHPTPIDLIRQYSEVAMRATRPGHNIVVVRHDLDIWVFDTPQAGPTAQIIDCVTVARTRGTGQPHGLVEVQSNLTPAQWVELHVEIMDQVNITLHDKRQARS